MHHSSTQRDIYEPSSVSHITAYRGDVTSHREDGARQRQWSHITQDGRFMCMVTGNHIDIMQTNDGQIIGAWTFGQTHLSNTSTCVTCVQDLTDNGVTKFIVGLSVNEVGVVCLFDMSSLRVTRAVKLPHLVKCIEVITTNFDTDLHHWVLVDQLKCFSGVVAVGTHQAHIYLLDLCLNDMCIMANEMSPRHVEMITPRTRDITDHRGYALQHGRHLCLHIDDESHVDTFVYSKPGCDSVTRFDKTQVYISALRYIPQSGTLAVGFNFGCYQLWKLSCPVLEYSSGYEDQTPPITHFTHQEPENDPKNFSYLWVTHGSTPSDGTQTQDNIVSSMVLYQLSYKKKLFYSRYGTYFEDLLMVGCRFEMFLTPYVYAHNTPCQSSRVLSCQIITDPHYTAPLKLGADESFEESIHGPDLSLCMIVWETYHSHMTQYYMGLFDLNRWYHSQMPTFFKKVSNCDFQCPYMAVYCLDSVLRHSPSDHILTAHIPWATKLLYKTSAPISPEQHFYPSSLQFDALCVLKSGLVTVQCLGLQRQTLMDLQQVGPRVLIDPAPIYHLCVSRGLMPRFLTSPGYQPLQETQREELLSLCLDNNLASFIKECITTWPTDSECIRQGCTLKFLLGWAWTKLGQAKELINKTTIPLFDWSGVDLDSRSLHTLHTCSHRLDLLTMVFRSFLTRSTPTTQEGCNELISKLEVCELISQHLKILLWFIDQRLLPERDDIDDDGPGPGYCYPISVLLEKYRTRRQQLNTIHKNVKATDVLLIDGLIDEMGPGVVAQMWGNGGHGSLYPPPSINELLNIYLTDSASLQHKHCLIIYVLFDLLSLHNSDYQQQKEFSERLSSFAQATGLSHNVTMQISAFWQLDHQQFEEAIAGLTSTAVTEDIGPWQHGRIIKSLLYQNQPKLALSYIRIRQPALCEPDLIKLHLTVLLANGLTSEALNYQRSYHDDLSRRDLMTHIIDGARQMRTMKQLLDHPLSPDEDAILCHHLRNHSDISSRQLLVMHYLLRGRYIEAIRLNEDIKINPNLTHTSKLVQTTHNLIVEKYRSCLPLVQRSLALKPGPLKPRHPGIVKQVSRPRPLSTVVKRNQGQHMTSRSDLISTVMDKIRECTFSEMQSVESQSPVIPTTPHEPFVFTPVTPKSTRRSSKSRFVFPDIDPPTTEVKANMSLCLTPTRQSNKRRLSRVMTDDAIEMLKTPPVVRRSQSRLSSLSQTPQPTPQSILKVRTLVQRTPSPQRSRNAVNDTAVTPPLLMDTPKQFTFSSAPATPKQLRFADSVILTSPPSPPRLTDSTISMETNTDENVTTPQPDKLFERTSNKPTVPAEERIVLELISSSNDDEVSVVSPRRDVRGDICVESVVSPPHRQLTNVLDTSDIFHTPPDHTHRYTDKDTIDGENQINDQSSPVKVQEADSSCDAQSQSPIHQNINVNAGRVDDSQLAETSYGFGFGVVDDMRVTNKNISLTLYSGETVHESRSLHLFKDDNSEGIDSENNAEMVASDEIDYTPRERVSIHSTPSPKQTPSPIVLAQQRLSAETSPKNVQVTSPTRRWKTLSPVTLAEQKLNNETFSVSPKNVHISPKNRDISPKLTRNPESLCPITIAEQNLAKDMIDITVLDTTYSNKGAMTPKSAKLLKGTEDESPIPSNVITVETTPLRPRSSRIYKSVEKEVIVQSDLSRFNQVNITQADLEFIRDNVTTPVTPRRRGRPRKIDKQREMAERLAAMEHTSTDDEIVSIEASKVDRRRTITLSQRVVDNEVNSSPERVLRRSTRAASVEKSIVYTPPEQTRRNVRSKSVEPQSFVDTVSDDRNCKIFLEKTDMNTQTTPGLTKRVSKKTTRFSPAEEQSGRNIREKSVDKIVDSAIETSSPEINRRSTRGASVEKSVQYNDNQESPQRRGKSTDKLSESRTESVFIPRRSTRASSVEKSLVYTPPEKERSSGRRAKSVEPFSDIITHSPPKQSRRKSVRASSVEKSVVYTPPDESKYRNRRSKSVEKSIVNTTYNIDMNTDSDSPVINRNIRSSSVEKTPPRSASEPTTPRRTRKPRVTDKTPTLDPLPENEIIGQLAADALWEEVNQEAREEETSDVRVTRRSSQRLRGASPSHDLWVPSPTRRRRSMVAGKISDEVTTNQVVTNQDMVTFTFSGPIQQSSSQDEVSDDDPPPPEFIFSPPISRGRRMTIDCATLANTPKSPPQDAPPAKRRSLKPSATPGGGVYDVLFLTPEDSPLDLEPTPRTPVRRRPLQSARNRKNRFGGIFHHRI